MSPSEFWTCTLREVFLFIEGRRKMIEFEFRSSWEQIRWQTAAIIQVEIKLHAKRGRTIKPTDLIKFDWDAAAPKQAQVSEKTLAKWAKWDEEMKKRYGK